MTPMSSALSGVDDEPGVGQGLLGGGHAEDDVLVRATDGLEVHPVLGLEVVDLAGGVAGRDLGVPARDALQAGVAGHEVAARRWGCRCRRG